MADYVTCYSGDYFVLASTCLSGVSHVLYTNISNAPCQGVFSAGNVEKQSTTNSDTIMNKTK